MRVNHQNRWIMLLLAGLMILSVALGRQAYGIAKAQFALREGVLQDYARLIADHFGRAVQTEIGFEHLFSLVRRLNNDGFFTLERGADLDAEKRRNQLADTPVAALSFVSQSEANVEHIYGAEHFRDLSVQDWLTNNMAFEHPFRILHVDMDRQTRHVILIPSSTESGVFAILLKRGFLYTQLEQGYSNQSLLPDVLGKSDDIKPFVSLKILAPNGDSVFATDNFQQKTGAISSKFPDAYAGLFADHTIQVSIARDAVDLFAFGVREASSLTTIAILLILTLVLGMAAILLLRRERLLTKLQDDFVARVSHELRTPLTQIHLYAESLLYDRFTDKKDQVKALAVIQRESIRLGNLVNNILLFSGPLEAGIHLEEAPYAIEDMLTQLEEDFTPMLSALNSRVSIDCDASITSRCHRDSVVQILGNLLDNALKYGPPAQQIELQASQTQSHVKICIKDQGPGIPEKFREQIFLSYFRLDRERQRVISGTGIGLSVAQELSQALGGSLQFQSDNKIGSRFCLKLPLD